MDGDCSGGLLRFATWQGVETKAAQYCQWSAIRWHGRIHYLLRSGLRPLEASITSLDGGLLFQLKLESEHRASVGPVGQRHLGGLAFGNPRNNC